MLQFIAASRNVPSDCLNFCQEVAITSKFYSSLTNDDLYITTFNTFVKNN